MKGSTVGHNGEFCVRRIGRTALWIGLAALALPASAQTDVLGQMDRQVMEIVNRVKPSVVSVRVRAARKAQSALPAWGEDNPGAPFIDEDRQIDILPVALTRDQGCGAPSASARARRIWPTRVKYQTSLLRSSRVGTGFVVDRDGTILTTTDVVGDNGQVQVRLWDGRELSGKVLGSDPPTGVAVVKVSGADLPALRLAAQDRPEPGQWAIIVGNQLDRDHSVWVGTLARTDVELAPTAPWIGTVPGAPGQKVAFQRLELSSSLPAGKLLQIDAPVGAGASGAPVLNSHGDVIGVVVATSDPMPRALAIGFDQSEEKARRNEEKARQRKERLGKENPEWQAQVQRVAAEAQRIGERAAEHAQALSAKIEEKAKRLAEEATERSKALQKRAEEEARRDAEDHSKSDADRQRLQAERERRMAEEMKPLMEDLQRKLDRELKPLEEQLKRQLDEDLKPLQEQLQKLNELLPMVQGLREIAVDLAPQISQAITQAHEAAHAALEAAVKASDLGPPPAPPAPSAPPSQPAPPASPSPTAPQAPAAPPAPAPLPAAYIPPALFALPALPAAAASPTPPPSPLPPRVSFWTGRGTGGGGSTYAIPAATAGWVVSQIHERGRVSHPFLGVRLEALKPEEREQLNAPQEARVRVGAVVPDTPAKEAGLQNGDLILEFDGKKIEDPAELAERLARLRAGERVSLEIWRDGKRQTLHVTPREMAFAQPFFRGPMIAMPGARPFIFRQDMAMPRGPMPRVMPVFPFGQVRATASGSGRTAQVTLEAQDAEMEAVLRELSRATGLPFSAEGEAARQHVTLKVERVPVDDLVESMERLFHLRSERQGDRITFRAR